MIKEKINERLNKLEQMMNNQEHLSSPESVLDCVDSIAKFWSVLQEDEKDYIDCARYAVEKQIEWK
jgi:hypothetical protein